MTDHRATRRQRRIIEEALESVLQGVFDEEDVYRVVGEAFPGVGDEALGRILRYHWLKKIGPRLDDERPAVEQR